MKADGKGRNQRRKFFRTIRPGTAPGTIVADPAAHPTLIHVMAYDKDGIIEKDLPDLSEIPTLLERWAVTWVNVDGLADGERIAKLGEIFGVHKLALEDAVSTHQRAKVESYGEHLFMVCRMLHAEGQYETEQISLFLGKNFLVTFQERPGDCFDPVRERIRQGRPTFRLAGPDYLAYGLVDAIVDHYFPVLETFGERLDEMEQRIYARPQTAAAEGVHGIRKDILLLRRAIWPMREAVSALAHAEEDGLVTANTRLFLRDCHDHVIMVIEMLENLRETTAGLMDLHHTQISNRMNEIMKVLTVIATIFIPLSFIAGLYGMNFDTNVSPWNMPELHWAFGYPFALVLMLAVALWQLLVFRRKGWIGRPEKPEKDERESRKG